MPVKQIKNNSKKGLSKYFNDCSLSIDKASFSIFILGTETEKDIFKALINLGFKYDYDVIKKDKMNMNYYIRMRQYFYGNSSVLFHYERKHGSCFYPSLWCVVQDPTKELLCYLDSLCNALGFSTKVSQIELAIDFQYCRKLHRFLKRHLQLKYNRGSPCLVGKGITKSYYSGHKAYSSKTTIVYRKVKERAKYMRLEIILNRRVIKQLGFDLTMEGVNDINISQFFCFKKFNYEKFFKHRKWLARHKLSGMSPISRSIALRLLRGVEFPKNGMVLISHLKQKGYLRPQRFFNDLLKTNKRFYKLVKGKQFLK